MNNLILLVQRSLLILAIVVNCVNGYSQFYKLPSDTNFYEIRSLFYQNNINSTDTGESGILNSFKSWENYWAPRVAPTGSFVHAAAALNWWNLHYEDFAEASIDFGSTWTEIGPKTNGLDGVGRLNCIAFDPTMEGTLYVGAADGGVWKSTNDGVSWSVLNTDKLPRIAVSTIAVDPSNSSTIFFGNGDRDDRTAVAVYTDGVYRTTNGGLTWVNITQNMFPPQNNLYHVNQLLIDPNSSKLYVATSVGIYKTNNRNASSVTWSGPYFPTNAFRGVVRNTNTGHIYAAGTDIVRSTDDGTTFHSLMTSAFGFSPSWQTGEYPYKMNLAISADNLFLYVLCFTNQLRQLVTSVHLN